MIFHRRTLFNVMIVASSIFIFCVQHLKADNPLEELVKKIEEDSNNGFYVFINSENEIYVCDGKDYERSGKLMEDINKTSLVDFGKRLSGFLSDKHKHVFIGAASDVKYDFLYKIINVISNEFLRKELSPYANYHFLSSEFLDHEKHPEKIVFDGKTNIEINIK